MDISSTTASLYSRYQLEMQQIADIRYSVAVLQWDQETYMPPGGADFRARQIATLSELAHSKFTSREFGDLLQSLSDRSDLTGEQRLNISLSLYDFDQQARLPAAHIRNLSEASSKAFHAWIKSRKANDFGLFSDALQILVTLKKQEAEFLGYEGHPYNALLNQYERGSNTIWLDHVFGELMEPLQNLLNKITVCPQVEDTMLKQFYPEIDQWNFGMELLGKMGYDFDRGRQDKSAHPFTTNFSSNDVRITTRIDENDVGNMTWSTIHELGHALYEQGLPASQYGLPLGEYASLSIHESQSRLWENNVGRSMSWCKQFLPIMQSYFPNQLGKISKDQFYKAINKVGASLIRTEADEITYHFHVIIRYELEKALIGGEIGVKDIPAYWNDAYKRFLGITVPDQRRGCLQDVHWSHGSFGYFPTYSLGSLYAAQFYATASEQIPDLEKKLANGEFSELLNWLRVNIHQHGRKYTSEELCKKVTGEGINIQHFMQYITDKYRFIYSFQTSKPK